MIPLRCGLMDGGAAFVMVKGDWRLKQPIEKLTGFIRLYRGLRDRDGGKYAVHYTQPTEALEALAVKAGVTLPRVEAKKGSKK